MRARKQSKLALAISISLIAGAVAILNFGGPLATTQAATACRGGDGGGTGTSTSTETSTGTSTSTETETDTGGLPTLPPLEERQGVPLPLQTTETESPSPSETDTGGLPTLPLPTGEDTETESPTGTASESPDGQARSCASEITITHRAVGRRNTRDLFRGKVRSEERDCRAGRRVVLKKKKRGPDRTVGRTRTRDNGKYRIVKKAKGRFYAVATNANVQTSEGRTRCRKDRSPAVKA